MNNYSSQECEPGWKKFGDSCYKYMGTGYQVGYAQDLCMEQGANLFFPETKEEIHFAEGLFSSNPDNIEKMFLGFKGYDEKHGLVINMDNSDNVGVRDFTSRISLKINMYLTFLNYFFQIF